MTLYVDPTGTLFELSREENGRIFYFPQGGGFERSCDKLDFDRNFKPAAPGPFYKAFVDGDWMEESDRLPAWLNGLRWNGWAQPRFEKSAADKIMNDTPGMLFDPERNAYVLPADLDMGRDEEEVFPAETIDTHDGPVTVWPIGAGYWCWQLI
jgi:hypothetical protein